MKIFNQKNFFHVTLLSCLISFASCFGLSKEASSKGFVYLHDVDPSIRISLRYIGDENFVGTCVDGYKKPAVIMTKQAAQALKNVQEDIKKDGYSLVVYDAY